MANAVQIGVLIIGSLYWDESEPRTAWRGERLDFEREKRVRVPIRYGRRSTTRGNTYTMVISSGLAEENFGTAIAVPFNSADMFNEAEHLWTAERDAPDGSDGTIAAGWGCVGLLEHPSGPLHREERERWTDRVQGKAVYGNLPHGRNERSAVSKSGFLSIDWPKTVNDSLLEWDVLLATATCPTLYNAEYPSSRHIAQAWQTSKCRVLLPDPALWIRAGSAHATFDEGSAHGRSVWVVFRSFSLFSHPVALGLETPS